jgi:hypothetical protein
MGQYCTLHLVDEEAIRTQFVPRLLGTDRAAPPTPSWWQRWRRDRSEPLPASAFDRLLPDADRRFRRARLSLTKRDPQVAAQYVCELAILYASAELPFGLSHNVSLSLWHRCQPPGAPDLPHDLTSSPELLFADLVAVHPHLAGHFSYGGFDGDGWPGEFVPAARVPVVLAWLEGVLAQIDPGERRAYSEIVRTLEIARDRGCAYWEATQLEVARPPEALPRRPLAARVEGVRMHVLEGPGGSLDYFGPLGTHLVISDSTSRRMFCFDANHWPPREMGSVTGYYRDPALSSTGDWLLMKRTADSKHVAIGLNRGRFDDRAWQPLALKGPPLTDFPRTGFLAMRAAVICRSPRDLRYRLLVQDGDRLAPGPWLPAPGPCGRPMAGDHYPRTGFAVLATGEPLIMWDGDLYSADEHALTKRFALAAPAVYESPDMIATPTGGLFFLSHCRLFEVRADGTIVAHAPDVDNIMRIVRGPEGTILVKQAPNPEDDIAKIYCPADGTWGSLSRELFAFPEQYEVATSVFWSRRTDLVIAQMQRICHAVPARTVLDLERSAPAGRRRRHEGYAITIKAATGHHDRVAALSQCYLDDVEARIEALLHRKTSPRPPRPFIVGLAIASDGAVVDVKVLGTNSDPLAATFADEIRQEPSPLFYPPATGAIQIDILIEYATRRLRRSVGLTVADSI